MEAVGGNPKAGRTPVLLSEDQKRMKLTDTTGRFILRTMIRNQPCGQCRVTEPTGKERIHGRSTAKRLNAQTNGRGCFRE
jgi:hypothetical protein